MVSYVMVMALLHSCELLGSINPSMYMLSLGLHLYIATLAIVLLEHHYGKLEISHCTVHKVAKC